MSRVGHSLWNASEVDSGQTLHVYIITHDPFGPAKVVVGVSNALHALLLALPRQVTSEFRKKLRSTPGLSRSELVSRNGAV